MAGPRRGVHQRLKLSVAILTLLAPVGPLLARFYFFKHYYPSVRESVREWSKAQDKKVQEMRARYNESLATQTVRKGGRHIRSLAQMSGREVEIYWVWKKARDLVVPERIKIMKRVRDEKEGVRRQPSLVRALPR